MSEISISNDVKELEKNISHSVQFEGNFDDPFKAKNQIKPKKTKTIPRKKEKPFKIALKGIIGNTALLHSDNELHYLAEKDSINSWIVQKIYKDSILIKNKEKELILKVKEKSKLY